MKVQWKSQSYYISIFYIFMLINDFFWVYGSFGDSYFNFIAFFSLYIKESQVNYYFIFMWKLFNHFMWNNKNYSNIN